MRVGVFRVVELPEGVAIRCDGDVGGFGMVGSSSR